MRRALLLLAACLALGLAAGCNISPEKDPGYYVQHEHPAPQTGEHC